MSSSTGLRVKLAAVLVVTLVFLGIALGGVDVEVALKAVRGFSVPVLLPMVACYMAAHLCRSWRLQILLAGEGTAPPYARVFSLNTVGFLAINVMPLRLGEMVRPYLLWERENVPLGTALAAVMMERLLDLMALLVMLLGVGFVVDIPADGLTVQGIDLVSAGQKTIGTLVGIGVVGAAVFVVVGDPVLELLRRLPLGPLGGRIAGLASRFREGLRALARRPLRLLLLVGVTAAVWILTILGVIAVMAGFDGIPASLSAAWATWTATITGMTLIPTPGFFGAYELFCSRALWLFDVDGDIAKAFAVVLHLGQLGFTMVIGTACLFVEGLSLRDLVRPAEAPGVDGVALDAQPEVEVEAGGAHSG